MKIKVAMLQILPTSSMHENMLKGIECCIKAKEMGADIIVFPEMYSTGYQIPQDLELLNSLAISKDSKFITTFQNLAKTLDVAIAITYLEAYDKAPRNSVILFDRFGNTVYNYAKVHTCLFGDEVVLTAGEEFFVETLNTKNGDILVGSMICYDREFPESARILMLKGAELILVPNACPMEINRISQLRGRAYENMLGIVTVNYPLGMPDCNGHSNAFDGVCYLEDLEGSRDTLIIEAPSEEGIYIAEFDMDMIRSYRAREVHGNAYRKPDKYSLLISRDKKEPFIRK